MIGVAEGTVLGVDVAAGPVLVGGSGVPVGGSGVGVFVWVGVRVGVAVGAGVMAKAIFCGKPLSAMSSPHRNTKPSAASRNHKGLGWRVCTGAEAASIRSSATCVAVWRAWCARKKRQLRWLPLRQYVSCSSSVRGDTR